MGDNGFQGIVLKFCKEVTAVPFLEECGVGWHGAKVDEVDGFDSFSHQKCAKRLVRFLVVTVLFLGTGKEMNQLYSDSICVIFQAKVNLIAAAIELIFKSVLTFRLAVRRF